MGSKKSRRGRCRRGKSSRVDVGKYREGGGGRIGNGRTKKGRKEDEEEGRKGGERNWRRGNYDEDGMYTHTTHLERFLIMPSFSLYNVHHPSPQTSGVWTPTGD